MNREQEEAAVLRYYLKGLTVAEIAKLLDMSERTVQRLRRRAGLRAAAQPLPAADRAAEMYRNGQTYNEIARRLNVTRQTVYNYLKRTGAIEGISTPPA